MSNLEPNIAILLAAYNGMQWIEEQLDSIQAQEGVNVHIFISVDASTDGTYEWGQNYARFCKNVTLLPPSEFSRGAARNFFRLLRDTPLNDFDLVAFADQDDRWHPNKLARAAAELATNVTQAYSSNVTAFWPDGAIRLLDKAQAQTKWDHYFEAAGPGCTYVLTKPFAVFVQQRVTLQWGALREVALHDWYIYALARTHGFRWYVDPVPSMDYRQHTRNEFGANVGIQALAERYRRIRNGWWFGQIKRIENLVNHDRPPVERPSWRKLRRSDFLWLSINAGQCRRATKDRILFRVLCITLAVLGVKVI